MNIIVYYDLQVHDGGDKAMFNSYRTPLVCNLVLWYKAPRSRAALEFPLGARTCWNLFDYYVFFTCSKVNQEHGPRNSLQNRMRCLTNG